MLIPIGTDRRLRRHPRVTQVLLALNVLAFVGTVLLRSGDTDLYERAMRVLALVPADPRGWQFVTYAFLHSLDDFWHIAGNMFFLWVFGPPVEDRLGRWKFLAFYLLAAAASAGVHAAMTSTPQAPLIGASGAISGIAGAFLVLFPRTNVRVFLFFFLIGVFSIPAIWFIGFNLIWNIFVTAAGASGNVATLAHLAGYAFGAGVALGGLASGLLDGERGDLVSLGRRKARRRQFRAAAEIRQKDQHARAKRKERADDEGDNDDSLAKLRAGLVSHVRERRFGEAERAYRALLDLEPRSPGAAVLAAPIQLDLANALYRMGRLDLAGAAYERFLGAYPEHPDSPGASLLLALLAARHFNDPVRARSLINQARPGLREDHERRLADQLIAELG